MKAGWGDSSSPYLRLCLFGSSTKGASCQKLPRFQYQDGRMPVFEVRSGNRHRFDNLQNPWRHGPGWQSFFCNGRYCVVGCCFNPPSDVDVFLQPCQVFPSLLFLPTAPPTGH